MISKIIEGRPSFRERNGFKPFINLKEGMLSELANISSDPMILFNDEREVRNQVFIWNDFTYDPEFVTSL